MISRERLSKKYNKVQDVSKKEEQILDKYNFDQNKVAYNYFGELISEAERNIKNNEEFTLAKIYKRIATENKKESYNVQNECQRLLNKTYIENQELFAEYKEKPSIREFILHELSAENNKTDSKEMKNIVQENIEVKTNYDEMLIQVPIKILTELYYLRGYKDRIKEERQ